MNKNKFNEDFFASVRETGIWKLLYHIRDLQESVDRTNSCAIVFQCEVFVRDSSLRYQ